MFKAALFIIAKTWKQPRYPATDEWIKKTWYTYTMEYYPNIEKNEINGIFSKMDGPRNYHTKSSQKEKDEYHMISLICGIENMTQMNLFTKHKQIHIEAPIINDTFCVWSMLCSSFVVAKEERTGDGCGVSD